MKLLLKSKQDYGTHVEEYDEEFECHKKEMGGTTLIEFQDGSIEIEESKITYIRGENKMEIEANKVTECDYETEQGILVLDIEAIDIEKTHQDIGVIARAKYKIIIVGVEPYTNELEIIIKECVKLSV